MNLPLLVSLALLLAPGPRAQAQAADTSQAAAAPTTADTTGQEPAATAPEAPPMLVELHSGRLLWGRLEAHDADGIQVRRLDNGGLARIPWTFLDPRQSEQLRLRFGYTETAGEELLVDAVRLTLANGNEVVGVIDGRTEDHLFLRTASARIPIPLASLVGAPTHVKVPALDVYTKEELYQKEAQQLADRLALDDERGAQAHLELAQYAESLLDYTHALEHYKRVAEIAPTFRTDLVTGAIARAESKVALQEQIDVLSEIDRLRGRKLYGDAIALLKEFPERYPNSPLLADWSKLRDRVAKRQEKDVREETARLWRLWTVKLVRKAVRTLDGYDAVLAYLDGQLETELEQKVAMELQRLAPGITSEEVRRFWDEREPARLTTSTYGSGTWLLGEDRALATLEPEKKEDQTAASSPREDARKSLEERFKRYLKNQEVQRRAQGGNGDDQGETPQDFWKGWSLAGRSQWALAYFAEFSGTYKVERVRFSNCRDCGGTGAKEVLFTGSAIADNNAGIRLYRCPTCHGIGRVRRIQYR